MTIQTELEQTQFLRVVDRLTHCIREKRGESPEILDEYKALLFNLIQAGNQHFKTQPKASKKKWTLLSQEARTALSPSFLNRHGLRALTLVTIVSTAALMSPRETAQVLEVIVPGAVDVPGIPFFQLWWFALQTLTMGVTCVCDEAIAQFDRFVGAQIGAPLLICIPFAIPAVQTAARLFKKCFKRLSS